MTDLPTELPLNKLTAWDGNVRKTAPHAGVEALAASIAAHGLLQSLVVRKAGRGQYAVIAGRRRLLALQSLAVDGRIAADYAVPCRVIAKRDDAAEISLAENVMREAMHPADEFEAFCDLADRGVPAADIAARFGVTETVVLKRLRLARVSPAILAAYREDDLTLEQVMAFAVSDDHAAQEQVFANLERGWSDDPDLIRDALTENEIPATDRRVRFVTREAYEAAGGTLRRDLFAEGDQGIFVADAPLLDRLVLEKLSGIASTIAEEGWQWTEIRPAFDYSEWSGYGRQHPEPVPLAPEEQAELDELTNAYEELSAINDDSEEHSARLDDILRRMDEIEDRDEIFPAETLAIAGAIVTIGHDGDPDVRRGYVRPADVRTLRQTEQASQVNAKTSEASGLPAKLIEELTAHKSAALAATLVERPDIALASIVYTLARDILTTGAPESALQLRASTPALTMAETSSATERLHRRREDWSARFPANAQQAWQWCLEQDRDVLLDLLAFCAACTVDAVQRKPDRADAPRLVHADLLARTLQLDMRHWYKPDAQGYFARIPKSAILTALKEARQTPAAPAWAKLPKSELAALAERVIAESGWLPAPLRLAQTDESDAVPQAEAA